MGLRYTDETLKGYSWSSTQQGAIYSGPFYGKIISKPWTYRAALDHQFTSNLLGYVSYDHGFKGGGFNRLLHPLRRSFPSNWTHTRRA